jgi:hypothetical protein
VDLHIDPRAASMAHQTNVFRDDQIHRYRRLGEGALMQHHARRWADELKRAIIDGASWRPRPEFVSPIKERLLG